MIGGLFPNVPDCTSSEAHKTANTTEPDVHASYNAASGVSNARRSIYAGNNRKQSCRMSISSRVLDTTDADDIASGVNRANLLAQLKREDISDIRIEYFSLTGIPEEFIAEKDLVAIGQHDLMFMDHSMGIVPPHPYYMACKKAFAYSCSLGNGIWETILSQEMPRAANYVKRMLNCGPEDPVTVEFAHNSHEFTVALMSTRFSRIMTNECTRPLRILTSDDEFYSIVRQLNSYTSATDRIVVEVIPHEPLDTFTERVYQRLQESDVLYDFLLFSHISFIQRTLIPNIREFVPEVRRILESKPLNNSDAILIIDGLVSCGAIDIDMRGLDCFLLGCTTKHFGCAINLCYALFPSKYAELRPMVTGWISDLNVLHGASMGVSVGSPVVYQPGTTFIGGSFAFMFPIVSFNSVMESWDRFGIAVPRIHEYIIGLHSLFISLLVDAERDNRVNPWINRSRLKFLAEEKIRSNSLVFTQDTCESAVDCVNAIGTFGITIDCRKNFVRVGFGFGHNTDDIFRLGRVLIMAVPSTHDPQGAQVAERAGSMRRISLG